mgnify:CR=1 FL=1
MSAVFSECGQYRLRLDREVDLFGGPTAALIGVNPSKANGTENDATIRKDIGFAKRFGWSHIIKGNEFAWCATDVRELAYVDDPVGSENDAYLRQIMAEADIIVPCWGPLAKVPKRFRSRWLEVVGIADELSKPLWCIGTVADGQPRHTLMTPYTTPLTEWKRPPPTGVTQ